MMPRKIPIMMPMPTTIIYLRELFWLCIRFMKLKLSGIAWVNWADMPMKTIAVTAIWILKMTVRLTVMVYLAVEPPLMIVVFAPVVILGMLPIVIKMTAVIVSGTMQIWTVMVIAVYRMVQPIWMTVVYVLVVIQGIWQIAIRIVMVTVLLIHLLVVKEKIVVRL